MFLLPPPWPLLSEGYSQDKCTLLQDGITVSFGNDPEALEALDSDVVIVDHKHWGRLRVSGEDRLKFLHGQSTADFLAMQPGTGCTTVGPDFHTVRLAR